MASSTSLEAMAVSSSSTCWMQKQSLRQLDASWMPHHGVRFCQPMMKSWTGGGAFVANLLWPRRRTHQITSQLRTRTHCSSSSGFPESDEPYLQDLRVPLEWVTSPAAAHEAEWLRGALQQWLDDEYCPEPANEEISRRCAQVYYYCLMEKQMDIGDILMQMVRDLETFSFKESFHGAFSSANAAIALITKRIGTLEGTDLQQ
ncbi:unnamed protein product [Sphagnum jensenii]|jgi:hypothetical protein|uniref:Uncharacterized protein n=1 Tax=Sphagnum jensenii TaxID=128206 RepID=A0ABP0VRL8_9BRYO